MDSISRKTKKKKVILIFAVIIIDSRKYSDVILKSFKFKILDLKKNMKFFKQFFFSRYVINISAVVVSSQPIVSFLPNFRGVSHWEQADLTRNTNAHKSYSSSRLHVCTYIYTLYSYVFHSCVCGPFEMCLPMILAARPIMIILLNISAGRFWI